MAKIDKEKEEKVIKKYRVQIGNDKNTPPPVSPTFGKFPAALWLKWDEDCNQNYNGTRWMKAWSDHETAMNSTKEKAMWNYMMTLNDKIDQLTDNLSEEEPEKPKKKKYKTLGDIPSNEVEEDEGDEK